jgi:hypothetical protein
MTISSGQAITVHPGCHILTIDHIITADDTNDVEIHSTWLDWTMSLAQLFDHSDSEQITQIVTELQSKITGAFDASELLQKFPILTLVVLITSSNDWNGAFTRFYFVPSVKKVLCKAFTTHQCCQVHWLHLPRVCPTLASNWLRSISTNLQLLNLLQSLIPETKGGPKETFKLFDVLIPFYFHLFALMQHFSTHLLTFFISLFYTCKSTLLVKTSNPKQGERYHIVIFHLNIRIKQMG